MGFSRRDFQSGVLKRDSQNQAAKLYSRPNIAQERGGRHHLQQAARLVKINAMREDPPVGYSKYVINGGPRMTVGYAVMSISCAARLPDSSAPSMVRPRSEVCSPAKCTRPSARASSGCQPVSSFGRHQA